MPTDGSTHNLIRSLKTSLQQLESLHSLNNEETEWVNKIIQHIRDKLAELDGD